MRARRVLAIATAGMVLALVAPAAEAVTFTQAPGSPFVVRNGPIELTVADFDVDGVPDLATASLLARVTKASLGNGNGSFFSGAAPFTTRAPTTLAAGDFDEDGVPDLLVGDFSYQDIRYDTIEVLLGDGDGTFTQGASMDVSPNRPLALAVADFDDDGHLDFTYPGGVMLGDGDGTFTPAPPLATGNAFAIVADDFDGDGNTDIAATFLTNNTVAVMLGNGDGTFTAAPSPGTGPGAEALAAGDFDGDGNVDLAAANSLTDSITVLLGNGDGTFTPAPSPATGDVPLSIAVGDFDADGVPDLATANADSDTVNVLLGNGDGTFTPDASPSVGNEPVSIVTADFDEDGYDDFATANFESDRNSVFLSDGPATPLVTGSGNTAKAPVNAFSIEAFATDGTLTYTGSSRSFDGDIQCTKVVGNAATIVAVDTSTNRGNRTMVQDNGPSGDKLINTMTDLGTLTQKQRDKFLACIDPDVAKLTAAPALTGDAIQVAGGQ